MATPLERSRNNVRAGIFVTVAIVLGVLTVIVLTDAWKKVTQPTDKYTATFEISEGVKNLKKGSEVRVGGVQLGRVKEVVPRMSPTAALTHIDVIFTLDSRYTLYSDAKIVVTPALIGGDSKLDIYFVGTPPPEGSPVEGPIQAVKTGSGTLAALLGPDDAGKASSVIDDLKATSTNVRELVGRIRNEDWPRWATSVDTVMTWATGATGKFDDILADGRGFVADARAVIADNRQSIDTTVENVELTSADVRDVAERIRAETMEKVDHLLESGQQGVDSAVSVLEKLDRDYDFWSEDVSDALASARLTGQQLKLGAIEIRRSPWKLLYSPTREELQHEMLYEAARSFAMAASDLKAASASVERLATTQSAALASDPKTMAMINEYLRDSLDRYAKAQQRLLDVLLAE